MSEAVLELIHCDERVITLRQRMDAIEAKCGHWATLRAELERELPPLRDAYLLLIEQLYREILTAARDATSPDEMVQRVKEVIRFEGPPEQ